MMLVSFSRNLISPINSHPNSDMFYIQFFQAAFPEIDFSQLEEANNEDEMAENIQALIELLGSQILKYDLSHISGREIVSGNPEHCINLL